MEESNNTVRIRKNSMSVLWQCCKPGPFLYIHFVLWKGKLLTQTTVLWIDIIYLFRCVEFFSRIETVFLRERGTSRKRIFWLVLNSIVSIHTKIYVRRATGKIGWLSSLRSDVSFAWKSSLFFSSQITNSLDLLPSWSTDVLHNNNRYSTQLGCIDEVFGWSMDV